MATLPLDEHLDRIKAEAALHEHEKPASPRPRYYIKLRVSGFYFRQGPNPQWTDAREYATAFDTHVTAQGYAVWTLSLNSAHFAIEVVS